MFATLFKSLFLRLCDQISGIQKATAKLIEGLEIQHEGSRFNVHFMTIIPYFKVTEKYDTGKACKVKG